MRTHRPVRRVLALGGLVALALTAAACSSGPAAPNAATAKADIGRVYNTLFNFSDKSLADKEAIVQGGPAIKNALEIGLTAPQASGVSGARVDSAAILSSSACTAKKVPAPCAQVAYDILGSNGAPVLGGQTGYASYSTGKWLVAKVTICGLLNTLYSIQGKTGFAPGCAP